jgi:ligand-binding sensor domain-containing protein/signal transduction histidine kinase
MCCNRKNYVRIILSAVIFFLIAQGVRSQKFNFIRYSVEEGLTQSQAFAIRQDSMRQLWITTLGGLSRFDGKNFTNYTTLDGLLSNFCTMLLIDSRQHVWIGSQLGVTRYDGRSFKNFPLTDQSASSSYVSEIVEANGMIWAVFDKKLRVYDYKGSQADVPACLQEKPIATIGKDFLNNLLVATNDGAIYKYTGNQCLAVKPDDNKLSKNCIVKKIHTSSTGNTWILTNKGLFQYDTKKIALTIWPIPGPVLSQAITVFEDREHSLWLGTHSGIFKIQSSNISYYNAANGFSDQQVKDIYQDIEGNLWISSNGSGIYKFSNSDLVYFDKSELPNPVVVGLSKDKKNNTWFGTYGGGLCKYDGKKITAYKLPASNKTADIINFCFTDKPGNIWVGTLGGGLWRYKDGSFTNISEKEAADQTIFNCAAEGDDGIIYFGTPKGLYQYSGNQMEKINSFTEFIGAVDIIGNDSILIGTANGVVLYSHGKRTPVGNSPELSKSLVFSITHSADRIFMGTLDKGIFIAERKNHNDLTWITKSTGISSNNIYCLLYDNNGRLWVSTGNYLNRISFSKNGAIGNIRVFDKNEGMFSPEGNANSLLLDDDYMWVGTSNGLYKIKTTTKESTPLPPVVFLKDVRLFSMPVTNTKYYDSLSGQYRIPYNLRLPYKKNHLTFEFQGVHLSNPEALKYQYYIKGIDKGFSEPGSSNSVIYSSIPPGKYHFVVRALVGETLTPSRELDYEFEIKTPFHQTIYFKLLIITCFLICGILIQASRTKTKEKRRKVLESIRLDEQQKIRKRTAEDFHDEMGNKVTRISVLSEILKDKSNDEEAVRKLIGQIKENSIALYNGTRDVIWSLSAESENLLQVLTRIKDFGIDLFGDTDIRFSYSGIDQCPPKIILPSDFSRDLIMIFKEGMNNILKYADCRNVSLDINFAFKDYIKIILQDDGRGFDINHIAKGHGIDNIQHRAKRMNAESDLHFQTGQGTIVTLKFRIP